MHSSRLLRSTLSAAVLTLSLAPIANANTVLHAAGDTAVAACAPIARTGTYRIVMSRDGEVPKLALLVLERSSGCQAATLVTEQGSAVLLVRSMDEGRLTGTMQTERGPAEVTFKFGEEGISGTVQRGKKSWAVSGEKTS